MFFQFCDLYLRPGFVLWILVIVFYSADPCFVLDLDEPDFILWTLATLIGLRFSTMTSEKKCCVPNCGAEKEILHKFPNPDKNPDRFRTWLHFVGGDILSLDNNTIFKNRRVCHLHFETKYHTRSKFLSPNAIPRLNLPATSITRLPFKDLSNQENSSGSSVDILPHNELSLDGMCQNQLNESLVRTEFETNKPVSCKKRKITSEIVSNEQQQCLQKEIHNLKCKNDTFQCKLKKSMNLSTNTAFQSALKKFKTLAAIFTIMQFREIKKPKMGRRFTKEEKVMALSIYKMGPKAYRYLSKIFILPSPSTLSRMISKASLQPGINESIFEILKKKVHTMTQDDKLCTLIFDEMALTPHFEYNRKKDKISGFVNHAGKSTKKIADHVLVFMVRGITRNYKQPIVYSFCSGSTPKEILASQIKEIIKKLHSIGFNVLATVCDQGASNTSAINYLIEETRREYIRKDKELHNMIFEIEGKQIIPLYDVPHLLKGMRNNLMTKNLKYSIDGKTKVAKWEHIMQLYENNPTYKGLKIIKNLTENHCNKDKIPKMKVKYAAQLFSQTVGKTMGYLAENGILPEETKDTADFIIFIDDLFDSLNGSMKNSDVRPGKNLLRNVTPSSSHEDIWLTAKPILKSMSFITAKGSTGTVPSITNWVKIIENMLILKNKLFSEYNIKSFWCRHLNQDPLENFFGSIRSHGIRNNSPTCAGFEAAFASLLINNLSSNYSPGSNCEKDFCTVLEGFNELIFENKIKINQSIEFGEDLLNNDDIIVDFEEKKKDPRIVAQLEYVTGYILRKAKTIYKNCEKCKQCFYTHDPNTNKYLQHREYLKTKKYLYYPTENATKCFSMIQDILHHILQKNSDVDNLKELMKTLLYINIDTSFIKCDHEKEIKEFLFDFASRFFAYNWCKWTNKLLNGTSTTKDVDKNDIIQCQALTYYMKRRKFKN